LTKYSANFKSPEAEAKYFGAYDAALKLWPVPYESIEIDTSYGSTHMLVSGPKDAPPVIFIHAFSASAIDWYGNVSDLSREHRIYAVEIPGDLNKSILTKPFGDRSGCVSWLSEVMGQLKIEKAVLVGHSYGGWFALNFALLAPENVDKAILIDPAATFVPLRIEFYLRACAMQLISSRAAVKNFACWAGAKGYKPDEEILGMLTEGRKAFKFSKNFIHVVQPGVFSDDELKNASTRVLLMLGEQEHLYDPFKAAERARRLLKNVRIEIVPDAGHTLNREQKSKVNRLMLEFMKE